MVVFFIHGSMGYMQQFDEQISYFTVSQRDAALTHDDDDDDDELSFLRLAK